MHTLCCQNCEYWDQRFRLNKWLGICTRLSAREMSYGTYRHIALSAHDWENIPGAFDAVRTQSDFGCNRYSPRWAERQESS